MDSVLIPLGAVGTLIALGWGLRRSEFLPDAAWAPIERLTYFVLFPALLFTELARADLRAGSALALGVVLLLAQLMLAGYASALHWLLHLSGPAYTSVVQGVVRWNSYVFFALVPAVLGREALPLAAVAIAVMVPIANLLSVAALARYGKGAEPSLTTFVSALARNPLIVACAMGVALNLSELRLPAVLVEPLAMLGRATLALGLLTVGAGLRPVTLPGSVRLLALVTFGKLVLMPCLALLLGAVFGLSPLAAGVALLAGAVPTATSSYILARLLGGDAELMAAIVTVTTLGALLTLPLFLLLTR